MSFVIRNGGFGDYLSNFKYDGDLPLPSYSWQISKAMVFSDLEYAVSANEILQEYGFCLGVICKAN